MGCEVTDFSWREWRIFEKVAEAGGWWWPWAIFLFAGVGIVPSYSTEGFTPWALYPGISCIMTPCLSLLKKLVAWLFEGSEARGSDLWGGLWSTSPIWQNAWVYSITFLFLSFISHATSLLSGSFRESMFVLKFAKVHTVSCFLFDTQAQCQLPFIYHQANTFSFETVNCTHFWSLGWRVGL